MRVLRIARVLKLLKTAKGVRRLLETVAHALPQVGNLGLLFLLLFFIFAALGVELFGTIGALFLIWWDEASPSAFSFSQWTYMVLVCDEDNPCEGLGRHASFANFGIAWLTLFRVSTGDNWNGIMKVLFDSFWNFEINSPGRAYALWRCHKCFSIGLWSQCETLCLIRVALLSSNTVIAYSFFYLLVVNINI